MREFFKESRNFANSVSKVDSEATHVLDDFRNANSTTNDGDGSSNGK